MNRHAKSYQTPSFPLLAYLQLLRLPNVFTAMADVAMGFIFVRGVAGLGRNGFGDVAELAVLIVASSLLYMAGMVLNDWFDYDVDRHERPHRPLPSGQISRRAAARLGWGLLAAGIIAASFAGFLAGFLAGSIRPLSVALALAACIFLYDGLLKRTPLGPVAMGACRALNVLLGMAATSAAWQTANWLTAAAIGVYIVGVTFYAHGEAGRSARSRLLLGIAVMMSGIVLLAQLPAHIRLTMAGSNWQFFMMLLGVLIAWQCLRPVFDPRPNKVQMAVKQSILSLVLLDAAVTLGIAGPIAAIAVLALLIPAAALGQWAYST